MRPTRLILTAPAVVVCITACAGSVRPNVQAVQAAATDTSVRAARATLERAVQFWRADSIDQLLAGSADFQAQVMGLQVSRSEVINFARTRTPGAYILLTPKQTGSCLDAAYETGAFTYRGTTDPSTPARYGSYAIGWTASGGSALLKTIVVDSASDPRRIVGRVSCQTWRSIQLRSRRLIVSVTPAFDHQGIPRGMYEDLNAGGWSKGWVDGECAAIGDKHNDYANVASSIDLGSVIHPDALSVFLGARLRVGDRTEVEVAGTPLKSGSCSTGYDPTSSTGVSTFFEGRSFALYISRRFADLRIGVGPTIQQTTVSMRQANVRAANPSRGTVSSEVGRESTTKTLPGLGAIVGYSLTLGGGFVADINARVSKGGSLALPTLPSYTPKSVSASSYSIGLGIGWAR